MFKARTFKAGRTGKAAGRRTPVGLAGPVAMVLCVSALPAMAGPRGERVVRGEASFHRQGRNTTITAGNNAVIEYDSFNIRRRQTVEFIQPSAGSRVLNRIVGPDPTSIRGTLRSNGVVYIVNPAGVIFGSSATVDVGGIYAAAGGLSNQDFISGNDHFTNVQGRVVNRGSIRSDSMVGLIGRRVANFGTVVAPEGTVTMVAGDEVWIGERGGHVYARFSTDAAREQAGGVTQAGSITGNQVLAGVGDYYALAVLDSSFIRAQTVALRGGTGTTTSVAGTIDVSNRAEGGVGGSVTVTGERVALRGAQIDASGDAGGGSVRIGGDFQGRGDIPNAERTYVAPGTTINADAVTTGAGGRVIVWSDVFTNYNGSITARGGAQGGDGGFAEVSGKDTLVFNGTANLSATDGAQGELLLDPRDITIANGGAAVVASNNEFGENSGSDVSFDADLITAITNTGTAVTLQANRDITINEAITSNNGGGDGGDITLQAGRSITISANITTDNGSFSATANETVANGVVNANRDAGAAVIDMDNNVVIDAGSGDVTLTLSTGAGLTNSTSGNIIVEDITTTGTVTITNNGPTAGSSIVIDGAGGNNSLLTAGNLALIVGGAGGGGSIGTGADPIAFTATNIEASGQSAGVFLDTTATVNVGGASGSITGLSTSAGGAIELSTGAGNITTSENITGTGTVDLTGAAIDLGANLTGNDDVVLTGPVTITGSRTVSAGAGQLDIVNTVTLSGVGATVTMIGTPSGGTPAITFQDTVSPDAGGSTLVLEQNGVDADFNIATGTDDVLEATDGIDQLQDGFDSIVFGRSDGTVNIGVGAVAFIDPVTIRTTDGNININGAITGTDDASFTLNPGASSNVRFGLTGTVVSTAGGDITINGDARVGEGFTATLDSAGGVITITGDVDGTTGGAAENIVLDAAAGDLTIGGTLGTGQALGLDDATITDAAAVSIGGVDIEGTFATTNALAGTFTATGSVTADAVNLNGTTFDFDAAVEVLTGAFTIGSTGATSVNFDATLTAAAGGIDITTTGAQTFDALVSTTGGGDVDLDGGAITLTGGITTAGANGNVGITNSGLLSIDGAVSATGTVTQTDNAGTVTVNANVTGVGVTFNSAVTMAGSREISAGTGALAFNSTLGFSSAAGTGTLTGDSIAFAGNVTPNGGGTTLVFQSPTATTDFSIATGLADELVSAASIAFLQNGFTELQFGRSNGQHDIQIGAATYQDPVLFQTPTSGDITVTGTITTATNGTVFFDVGASNRIILDVTGNAVVTTGEEINFGGAVRIAEGEAPIIDSANGAIRFGGAVDGTTGGAAESLILDAGAGNIDFQSVASAVSGASGAADATGLTTLTITDANNLDIQSILISGVFSTTNPLTGAVQAVGTVQAGTIDLDADSFDFDAAVTAGAGGVDLVAAGAINFDSTLTAGAGGVTTSGTTHTFDGLISTSGGGDVDLDGTAITITGGITTAGGTANVDITNSGVLDIDGAITADGTFTQNDNGGTVSLGANISTASADGTIQFNSAVTATTGLTLDSGAGAIDLNSTFAAGANSIIFETNDFQPSGADTVTGTGVVTLRPENISDSIDLGSASTGATATYDLSDLAALADGFSLIRIGHITTGTHTVSMQGFSGGSALRDDMIIHAPAGAGQITLLDDLDVGAEDLTFDGAFLAGANLDIDTNALGGVTFNETADFQAFDVSLTGAGLPTFTGALSGSGTLTVRPDLATDAIDIGDVVAAGGALQGGLVVTQTDLQSLNDADFAAIEFGYAVTGEHSIQLADTTGATAWNSDVVFHAPAGAGLITVLADQLVDTTGNANATGDMTFDGDVVIGNPVTITVEDLLTFEQGLDIDGNNTTLASGDLDFNGGASSVVNTGAAATLTLSPASSAADIDIGDPGGNAQAGAWSLTDAELSAIDASIGSLAFGTPTTGSHSIFIGLITALNFDATFHAPSGEIRLHDDITAVGADNVGRALVFDSDVRIANTTTPTISTNGTAGDADITFNFGIFGSLTGAGETLTLDADTGNVSVAGTISGQTNGTSSATGLTDVTITANNVDLGTGAGALGAVDITGLLTVDNAGILDIDDDVLADGGLDQNSTATTGTVTLGADVTSINTAISFFSDVTLTADAELSSGTGLVEIGAGSTFDTAGFDLTITSRDIDVLGTLGGGDGTNTLTLRPDLATGAIDLGTLTGSTAGALVLDATDLSNIAGGFGGIEIGFAGTGSHSFLIGDAAFIDPLTLHAPAAGGGFEVEASRTLSGTDDASITFLGSHSTLVLNNGARITTAGMDINIDDDIRLADGAGDTGFNADIPLIDTGAGGGDVTIDGSIFGTDNASTMVERLRIRAGTGTITVGDALTVNGTTTNITGIQAGTASDQGLVDFRIVSAAGVTLEGVNIAGGLETETDLTGAFVANEEVLAQSITLGGTSFNFVDGFGATNNGGGAAAFTNSGTVTTTEGEATGDLTTTGDMTADILESDASIAIGGDLILGDEATADTDITVSGGAVIGDRLVAGNNINLAGDLEFAVNATATRGLFAAGTVTAGGDILTNGQNVTIRTAEANFNGGASSVQGGGTLTIRPFVSSGDMSFGFAADTGAGVLDLTDTDLAALASGFTTVVFGVAGGTHDMVVSSATFRNASNFNYQAGTMLIQGPVVATLAGADLLFLGADAGGTTLSGNITSNNGASITIDDNVTLGADSVLTMNGGPGTIEIDGTVDGAFGLIIAGGSGLVEIDGLIGGSTALSSLAISGEEVNLASGIGTSGAAGVTGATGITATTTLTLGGENYNTNLAAYQTGGTGSILGAGSGSTATFNSNGQTLTFDGAGAGEFILGDGVGLTATTGGGDINLAAAFSGEAGAILFDGPVVLTGNTSINNEGPGAASTVTFAETVDGEFDLAVTTAGGSVFFLGDVGTTEALANLTVDSASDIELENIGAGDDVGVAGDLDLTAAGDIMFNGTNYAARSASFEAGGQHTVASGATTFSTRGEAISFAGGDIVLIDGSDLTVSTGGGAGTFTSIRGDSDENVTLDLGTGVATVAGIGTGDEIGDILIIANNMNLNGNVFGNTFTLETGSTGRNIEIAGDGSTPSALRLSRQEFARIRDGFSSVTIGRADGQGTIVVGGDGGGALAFNDALSLLNSGALVSSILIQEELMGVGADASLFLDSGSVLLSSNISTQGADVTFDAATFLGADASITTDGGNVLFTDAGTIDNITGGGPFGLTVDAGDGSVTVEGDIGLNNQPDDTPLAFTNFTGSTISLQQVATEGDQTYTGAATLGGNLTANDGTILIDGIATLANDISVAAGDGIDSGTADVIFRGNVIGGDNDLVVIADGDASADAAGNALFEGNVSGLRSLVVVAGVIEAGNVTTASPQTYSATDRMELGGTLRATDDGDIDIDGNVVLTANSAINVSGGVGRTSSIMIDGTVVSDASSGPFDLTLTGAQGGITITGAVGGAPNASDALRLDDLTITGPSQVSLQGVRVASSLDIQTRSATLNGPVDSDGRLVVSVNETVQTRGTIDVEGNAVFNGLNINLGDDAADAINIDGLLLVGPADPDEENRTARVVVLAPITVNGSDIPPAAPGEDDTAAMTFNVDRLILRNRLEVTAGDIRIDNAGRFAMDRAASDIVLNGGNLDQVGEGNVILGFEGDTLEINAVRASRLAFDGPITLAGDASIRGGRLEFNGGINDDSAAARRALSLTSSRQTVITGDVGAVNPIGSLTTAGAGRTLLSADLIAAGPMQFSQRMELAGDSVIDARAGGLDGTIVFDSTVDDDGNSATSGDLVVLTDTTRFGPDLPTITFRAPVGATSAIDSLSLNIGAGSTQRASLGQQTVVVNPGTPDERVLTVFAPLVPTVIFDPAALDSLSGVTALGPAGARGMAVRTTGDFALGTGEKMAVSFGYEGRDAGTFVLDGQGRRNIGGETIIQSGFDSNNAPTFAIVTTGGGNVSLSDVTVDGNLVIDAAGAITFTRRADPSLVLSRPDTFESVDEYYNRILANEVDSGSDLFVNGFMYFSDDPTNTINMGTPFAFDQPRTNLGGSVPLEPENFSFRALIISEAEAQTFFGVSGGSSFSPLLDVRAEGTSGQQSDIQQQAPPEAQSGTVEEATAIGSTAKELLADAGINTRDPEDFLDALLGRALYDDLSSDGSGATYATVNRFSRDIAVELAREYTAFFRPPALDENGQPIIDPETGEPQVQDRRGEVRGRLNRALVDYRRQAGAQFDPASFRQFLRTNPDYVESEADMLALESILQKFRVLGLSPREYLRAREVTLTYVKPDRISLAQFIDVVEAQPGQGSTSDLVPLLEEEAAPEAQEEPAANPS